MSLADLENSCSYGLNIISSSEIFAVLTEFDLTILYTQIVVQHADLQLPGLLWDDDHLDQGFAWSEGIVGFGVPDHDGQCFLRIDVSDELKLDAGAEWAVRVPFEVDSLLKIGTVTNMRDVFVPKGLYGLVFQALPGSAMAGAGYTYVLLLTFIKSADRSFDILQQGRLATDKVLRMDAQRT